MGVVLEWVNEFEVVDDVVGVECWEDFEGVVVGGVVGLVVLGDIEYDSGDVVVEVGLFFDKVGGGGDDVVGGSVVGEEFGDLVFGYGVVYVVGVEEEYVVVFDGVFEIEWFDGGFEFYGVCEDVLYVVLRKCVGFGEVGEGVVVLEVNGGVVDVEIEELVVFDDGDVECVEEFG